MWRSASRGTAAAIGRAQDYPQVTISPTFLAPRPSSTCARRPIYPEVTGHMTGDRRHSPPRLRALEMIEERALGGTLAGTLYVTGAITAATILLVPGVERTHWRLMLGLAAIGFAWAACCFFVIPWERAHPLV